MTTSVGLANIPDEVRLLTSLDRVDYVDHFRATTGAVMERSPEGWARRVLEETALGRSAPSLWRLLGLQLGPRPSDDHVQGWRIDARGDDWLRLETRSPLMTGQAVVHRDTTSVSLALFLRFDRALAKVVWAPVSVMHRRAVPKMLVQALSLRGRDRGRTDGTEEPEVR